MDSFAGFQEMSYEAICVATAPLLSSMVRWAFADPLLPPKSEGSKHKVGVQKGVWRMVETKKS